MLAFPASDENLCFSNWIFFLYSLCRLVCASSYKEPLERKNIIKNSWIITCANWLVRIHVAFIIYVKCNLCMSGLEANEKHWNNKSRNEEDEKKETITWKSVRRKLLISFPHSLDCFLESFAGKRFTLVWFHLKCLDWQALKGSKLSVLSSQPFFLLPLDIFSAVSCDNLSTFHSNKVILRFDRWSTPKCPPQAAHETSFKIHDSKQISEI